MIRTRYFAAGLVGATFISLHLAAAVVAREPAGRGLSVAEFEKLHKQLQPPKDELWRTIPWQVSILEGRQAAAKTGKPIFVWVASGEPLGCG